MTDEPFTSFFRRNYLRVVAVAEGILHDRQLAEDVAQATMLRVYERYPDISDGDWLLIRAITINAAIDLKRRRRDRIGDIPDKEFPDTPIASVLVAEIVAEVTRAVESLTPMQRQAIHLAFWEGLSHAQIAQVQEVSTSSVKNRIRYAKGILHSKLRDIRLIIPGIASRNVPKMRAVEKGMQVGMISLITITVITTLTQIPGAGPDAKPVVTPISTTELRSELEPVSVGRTESSNLGHVPARTERDWHEITSPVEVGTGDPEDGPGAAGIHIGPIGVNCETDDSATVRTILCDVLFTGER